jgi:hypothetical protein
MTVEIGTGATDVVVPHRTETRNSSGASVSTFIFGEKTNAAVAGATSPARTSSISTSDVDAS